MPEHARRARVLLPLPLAGAYDYAVPPELETAAGDFVRVPLGNRSLVGVVWDRADEPPVEAARLKPVIERYEALRLPEVSRRLIDRVSAYTLSPPGAVLRMAMGPSDLLLPDAPRKAYEASPSVDVRRLTPARRRVLDLLIDGPPQGALALAREAGCTPGVIAGMVKAGLLKEIAASARPPRPVPDWRLPHPPLSPAQLSAAETIADAVRERRFDTMLLDGVTGSGKTEVYFRAIAAALAAGRQALVLLPEIALGTQWHERFAAQFGCRAASWHSEVAGPERRRVWRDVADGAARVVVGARSALFLPFCDLGLIVVDEEHDASFKQEDGVIYHARDMAVLRASLGDCPIVLASATPSLESLVNVERGRYRRLVLPARYGGARMPSIELVDLRVDRPERQSFLAPTLVSAIEATLATGEQVMLFLNRRGYAPLTLCRSCGHRLECRNCSAWLVEHRLVGRLVCHHCGYATKLPGRCPECDAENSLAACGPGVERVAEEVARRFPAARAAVMASDTLAGPQAMRDLIAAVHDHTIDLLIGTQIMAKGHHFPMLTLVGVVDADLGLNGGDLRAAERTYQLLHQVSGRAGRASHPGRVMLQTYDPEHPVMHALASGERDRFLAAETADRRRQGWPPFGRLAAIIVSAPDAGIAESAAQAIARAQPHIRGVTILGPAPAPLSILRGRWRYRFLIKAERGVNIQAMLRAWMGCVRLPSAVRVQLDIDPMSFL